MTESKTFRYELGVEGMSCVKCTGKVEKALLELGQPIKNLKIDFILAKFFSLAIMKELLSLHLKQS